MFGLAVSAWAQAPSPAWPEVPSPRGASSYWVAPHIVHNTIPMRIFAFEARESLELTRRFYDQWFADKRDASITRMDGVDILGARLGDFHVSVELRRGAGDRGATGRVTTALVYNADAPSGAERVERLGQGFPRPVGSDVLSDTVSYDSDRRNRTLTIRNGMSVETNALYLREQLILQGWTVIQDKTVRGGLHSSLVFRKAGEELVVNIGMRDGDCYVVTSQTMQGG
ncbi:MAG: hypothetical protein REU00_03650 [Pseudomonadota bacterium]|nr:hypothetical protein [Pseudomonadota bacterium]